MLSTRRAASIALTLGSLVSARSAAAYDLTTSSAGAPVHWKAGAVTFTLALEPGPGSGKVDAASTGRAASSAVATWQAALAGDGGDVAIGIAAEPVAAAPHSDDGINTIRWELRKDDPDLYAPEITGYRTPCPNLGHFPDKQTSTDNECHVIKPGKVPGARGARPGS